MKAALSFIRWKFVIPAGLLVAGIVAFFLMFFDPLLAGAIEKVGSRVNGAKVDVTGLKTKIFKGRLEIARLQVTNRKDPMKNTVEAGPLAFQLDVGQLLKRRFIIPDAQMNGIQFGTDRSVSGFIPAPKEKKKEKDEKPSAASKLVNKYKNRFQLNLDGLKGQVKEKIEFDPKDLEITRQGEALKGKAEALPVQWKAKVDDINVDGRLKKIETDVQGLKKTPTKGLEAVTAIPKALETLKTSKAELNQIKTDVQSVKGSFTQEIKDLKSQTRNLKKARKKDLETLSGKLNLEFADPERLVEGLIGDAVLGRIQTALRYVELARKHLPSKKEKESLPDKPRAEGMDIEFPRPASPPRFWLKRASLAGLIKDVDIAGEMTGLTSDPSRIGEPFVMNLNGNKGPQTYSGKVTADHVGDEKKDSFILSAKGLQISKLDSGGILGESLTKGDGAAEFVFYAKGEEKIGGQIEMNVGRLAFDDTLLITAAGLDANKDSREENLKINFVKKVARSIEKMDAVQLEAQLFGTWADPDIKLSSNLGKTLSGVLKATVGDAVKEQRKELEAQLDNILKNQQSDIQSTLAQIQGKLDSRFSGYQQKIQEEINNAAGINLSPAKESSGGGSPVKIPSLDSLDKLFK